MLTSQQDTRNPVGFCSVLTVTFLAQVTEDLKRKRQSAGYHRQGRTVRGQKFRGILDYSDHECWSSGSWEKGIKPNSSITPLDFRRTGLFRDQEIIMERRRVQNWLIFIISSSQAQEWLILAKVAGGLHGWKATCAELKCKKEAYKNFKSSNRRTRDTLWACDNGVRKAKEHLDFNLGRNMRGKKKGFQTHKGQGGFLRRKTYFMNVIVTFKEFSSLTDEKRAAHVYLNIRRTLTPCPITFLRTNWWSTG